MDHTKPQQTWDLRKLRLYCRKGLRDNDTRKWVWPKVLGITEADMQEDARILDVETERQATAKSSLEDYRIRYLEYSRRVRNIENAKNDQVAEPSSVGETSESLDNSTPTEDFSDSSPSISLKMQDPADKMCCEKMPEHIGLLEPDYTNNFLDLQDLPSTAPSLDFMKYNDTSSRREYSTKSKKNIEKFSSDASPGDPPIPPSMPTEYWDQVHCDVIRSLWNFVPNPEERERQREKLQKIIIAILTTTKDRKELVVHYFQGFHDIASILLLVAGEDIAFSILKRISNYYLLDSMRSDNGYLELQLNMTFSLMKLADSSLYEYLNKLNIRPTVFLPWILTWFSHDLTNINSICKLFDLFLASHPLMPVYVSCCYVIHAQKTIYQCESTFEEVHHFISKVPNLDIPPSVIIEKSLNLFQKYPPNPIMSTLNFPEDSCILEYPYPWVPENEVLLPISWTHTVLRSKYFWIIASICVGIAYHYFQHQKLFGISQFFLKNMNLKNKNYPNN